MTEHLKILVLDEALTDGMGNYPHLECNVGDLPVTFDDMVNAYEDRDMTVFAKILLDWPLIHLWPHVRGHAKNGEIDVLVTFVAHDPGGLCEMEFFLKDGEL